MILPLFGLMLQSNPDSILNRSYAVGAQDAILMLPPETVCGVEAQEMFWTADGSSLVVLRRASDAKGEDYAAALRDPSPDVLARFQPRTEIVVWGAKSRKAVTALSLPANTVLATKCYTMPGTDRFVFETQRPIPATPDHTAGLAATISILDAGTRTVTKLSESFITDEETHEAFAVAPKGGLGLIQRIDADGKGVMVRFFGADGHVGRSFKIAESMSFDGDGYPGYEKAMRRPNGKPFSMFQRVDPTTGRDGALVDYVFRSDQEEDESSKDALLGADAEKAATSGIAHVAPTITLRVRGGKPEEGGVVTTDGSEPLLSPKFDAIAYVSQGSAMVRNLVRVPRKAYEKARDDALKAVAISNAKQAVLGCIMYSADNDDEFPPPGGVGEKIYSYLKSHEIVDSFVYTFGGGKQTEIEDIAGTEIGYVLGPGGRAVAYADGHVKWVPDAP